NQSTWILFFEQAGAAEWTTGDVYLIKYANNIIPSANAGGDSYTFSTTSKTFNSANAAVDVEKINVFPNPYYAVNTEELNKFQKFVTFNHLPANVKIRIFNLGGVMVKTIEKVGGSQFQRWDLQNDAGLPVGSGIYIAYIEMPDLGTTKIIKLAVIQEEQILDRF
ncbi:MAG: T9SS type A sorting domain-containing protein, partial [Bacteroidetes bacterium]|nr:T9SS type A sorting domain-containing protein [Bacteroidota bacterium]